MTGMCKYPSSGGGGSSALLMQASLKGSGVQVTFLSSLQGWGVPVSYLCKYPFGGGGFRPLLGMHFIPVRIGIKV